MNDAVFVDIGTGGALGTSDREHVGRGREFRLAKLATNKRLLLLERQYLDLKVLEPFHG